MKIKEETLLHVAKTARINLTNEEKKEFLPQLQQIIGSFSEIKNVDTEDTMPSFHPIELKGMLRKDVPKNSLSNEDALKNSKNNKDGYIKGPRIL